MFSDMSNACNQHVPWVMTLHTASSSTRGRASGCNFPGSFSQPEPSTQAIDISTDFVVSVSSGYAASFNLNPVAKTFKSATSADGSYATSPWVTSTRIGTGVYGIFAIDTTSGQIAWMR